ncbi:hypothetical protein D3C76_920540 [compost metagenome]
MVPAVVVPSGWYSTLLAELVMVTSVLTGFITFRTVLPLINNAPLLQLVLSAQALLASFAAQTLMMVRCMTASLRASCSMPSIRLVVLLRRLSRIRLRKFGALTDARMATIAITTINSIRVNPVDFTGRRIDAFLTLWIEVMLPFLVGNVLFLWMIVADRTMSGRRPAASVNRFAKCLCAGQRGHRVVLAALS